MFVENFYLPRRSKTIKKLRKFTWQLLSSFYMDYLHSRWTFPHICNCCRTSQKIKDKHIVFDIPYKHVLPWRQFSACNPWTQWQFHGRKVYVHSSLKRPDENSCETSVIMSVWNIKCKYIRYNIGNEFTYVKRPQYSPSNSQFSSSAGDCVWSKSYSSSPLYSIGGL